MEIISGLPAECFHPSFKNGQDGASGRGSYLSQAAGGGKSLSLQLPQASGRLDGLCLPQPGTEEPSQATVRVYSINGMTCLLVSWFCACAYIQVLFPEGAVPAERFTHCSLLHPHSPVSVHRSSSPQHSRVRREEILSFLSRGELRTAVARRGGVFSAQV